MLRCDRVLICVTMRNRPTLNVFFVEANCSLSVLPNKVFICIRPCKPLRSYNKSAVRISSFVVVYSRIATAIACASP